MLNNTSSAMFIHVIMPNNTMQQHLIKYYISIFVYGTLYSDTTNIYAELCVYDNNAEQYWAAASYRHIITEF